MSTRIHSAISRATGIKNYQDVLAKVTGHYMSLDKETYTREIGKIIMMFEKCILPEIKKLNEKEATTIEKLFNKLDLKHLTKTKTKKSGKVSTSWRLRPKEIYESEWFKQLRTIENNAMSFCKQFGIETSGITDEVKKGIEENINSAKITKFLGRTILEDSIYSGKGELKVVQAAFVIREYSKKITEIILTPMYDVKNYMKNHWIPQIDQVLNLKITEETGKEEITLDDIQEYLYSYILLEYRLEVTGSTAEATKVIMDTLSVTDSEKFSASNLATVIERFKLDDIKNGDNIKKFAGMAAAELKKISNNEDITPEEILRDLDAIINANPEPENDQNESAENPSKEDLPEDVFSDVLDKEKKEEESQDEVSDEESNEESQDEVSDEAFKNLPEDVFEGEIKNESDN
jgi:hypothetical protein